MSNFFTDNYKDIENKVYKSLKDNPQNTISITAKKYQSLVNKTTKIYFIHEDGLWQKDTDLNKVRLDKEYISKNLIKKEEIILDYTNVFKKVIEDLKALGGGSVLVPPGKFYTGAIELFSNITLHLEKDAVLAFLPNISNEFYPLRRSRFEGIEVINFSPLIYAKDCCNITIEGRGTVDGGADLFNWMPFKYGLFNIKSQERIRNQIFQMAEKDIAVENRVFDDKTSTLRPCFIVPYNCKNVKITGITINNAPFWNINPIFCENVLIKGLNINSCYFNNDGCDPESCTNVIIEDCIFNTGDDCIAIKSRRNADGEKYHKASENIIIRNNLFKDGHGGITIGSEISGGCQNIYAHDNIFDSPRLDYAIRFKTNRMRGGVIEKIYIWNSTIKKAKVSLIYADFFYEEGENGSRTPVLQDCYFENIKSPKTASEVATYPMVLKGFTDSKIKNFYLKNIELYGIKHESVLENVENINLENVIVHYI